MTRCSAFTAARPLRAACILGFLIAAAAFAIAVEPSPSSPVSSQAGKIAAPSVKPVTTKPLWMELTPPQKQALAPLAAEWDTMDTIRKEKWLQIGNKYSKMKPDEQQRVQERMREWAKLTPEQRRIARENYTRTKKLNPDQKSAHWQEYQQLPDDQKQKLAAEAPHKKHVVNLPSGKTKTKTIAPIKSTPKPVLEQSVKPNKVANPGQTATQQPAPPPQPASK